MAKRPTPKAGKSKQTTARAARLAARRELQRGLRLEREVQALANKLLRTINTSDRMLGDLADVLMSRTLRLDAEIDRDSPPAVPARPIEPDSRSARVDQPGEREHASSSTV
jgi:hypothetical protein